ncbi:phytoene desaturase family protein [Sphingomonas sp. SUN019]|uniref:1-hydroxycarotenoid 3,4-desaturase CrtD n=1 Tax=Sphingomonas sp. SUN019 TaxID=2937788 RepID=UPI0021646747|nr:1-hydroxycarotenoid 3,4-desaturase CrtD [Sphingomonas sp. SUN019]UVO50843.1 phytoene desaturase family protein [Sphingomonas sp. SUN019]
MPDGRVIVIGAGIGGLTSAALLAARGCDVTVVEAADTPGGKVRAIDVGGRMVEAGPTVFTLREIFEEVFGECGASLDDHVVTQRADILARHAWREQRLDLYADRQASEDAIGAFAGAAEARGYRDFSAEARRLYDALDRPFLRRTKTDPLTLGWRMGVGGLRDYATLRPYSSMWRALGGYFADPRLRQLFARYATYCGSSPFRTPATLMLIAHVEARGVWLIEGGLSALASALEGLAKRQGARFRYAAPVSRIVVDNGRAAGVELASGERISADSVVCNADPAALGDGRFGVTATRRVPPASRSLGALVWLANVQSDGFPLTRHNVFFSSDYPSEFAALHAGRQPDDPTVYVCAQDRAANEGQIDGPERLQIIVNAPATGDRAGPSPQEIERCQHAMRTRLSQAGLSVDWTAPTKLLTPHDFERLCPSTGGALYGRASHGWAASFLRQGSRTRIPGLYCAGGSTHPGAGVPMAALSGRLAADCLLRDRASTFAWTRAAMPGGTSTRRAETVATG